MISEINVTACALITAPYLQDDGEILDKVTEVLITGKVEWNPERTQYRIYDLDCTDEDGGSVFVHDNIACAKIMMRYFEMMRML